jgi:tetratricopeptide (TPR) repeat protein
LSLADDEIPQFKRRGPGLRAFLILLLLGAGGAGVYYAYPALLPWLQGNLPFLASESPAPSAAPAASASQAPPPASASASAAPAEKSPVDPDAIAEENQPTEPCEKLAQEEPALPTPDKGGPTPTWQSMRGTHLLHAGAFQKALRHFCVSLAVHPDHEGLQLGYLQTLLQLRDAKTAVERGEKFIEQHPKSYQMHIALGDAYAHLGDWDRAKRAWLAAVKAEPGNSEATERFVGQQLNLAREALREQRFESAKRSFRRAAVLDKSNVEASTGVAQACLRMKEFKLAVPWARRALESRPGAMGQHVLLGRALAAAGKTDAAIETLKKALKINPGEPETLRLIGELKSRNR